MESSGWVIDLNREEKDTSEEGMDRCKRGDNWFGWTHRGIGSVRASLRGSGVADLDFGNCWTSGVVRVYLNEKEVASAKENTPSKNISFNFLDGDVLKLQDEGGNSVIVLNRILFRKIPGKFNMLK